MVKKIYISRYPENEGLFNQFSEVLELVRKEIIENNYVIASNILKKEIKRYWVYVNDTKYLNFLWYYILLDATVDYYFLNDQRSGANKNYIMSYLITRIDWMHYEEVRSIFTNMVSLSSILRNSYGLDSYNSGVRLISIGTYKNILMPLPEKGLTAKESEFITNLYQISANTDYLGGPIVTESLMYDYLVRDLFIMSDYQSDIQLYSSKDKEIRKACEAAVSYSGGRISIKDTEFNGVLVGVTYRKSKALEFYKKYYGGEIINVK